MATALLQTKLYTPPPRPELVPRPRLIERLNAGVHRKLTLISAQAGFGKTTLAAEWLSGVEKTVVWLTLDEMDNDPARFLTYLIAAIKQVDSRAGQIAQELLQAPQQPSPDFIVTTLLNEIVAIPQQFILAIDDYHLIQTPAIHQQLAFVIEHQPPNMHLVIVSREDPPLPLPRLRVRNQITEIRQNDLRFTTQEIARFLKNVMGLDIPPEDVYALELRTEGWIAGLQLAALSMQGRDDVHGFVQEFTGSNRYVLDYLIEEVFEIQSGEMQDFLLKTSILERLCGELCDAIMEKTGSQDLLETLEQANLFIHPLDQTRTWYRYHRLFKELLRNRLRALENSAQIALHQRASQWYENKRLLSEAIFHSIAAADWHRVTELLQTVSDEMLKRGQVFSLLEWYRQVPDDLILADPTLCLDYSWPLILAQQYEAATPYLDRAEKNALDDPAFFGRILTAKAYLLRAQGDHAHMVEVSQKALTLLPKSDVDSRCIVATNLGIAYWHGGHIQAAEHVLAEAYETALITENHYARMTVLVFRGLVLAVRGQLQEAATCFRQAIHQDYPTFTAGLANMYLSVLYYEWNNLETSTQYLLKAIDIGERLESDELLVSCWMVMAQLYMASGNLKAASDVLQKAQQRVTDGQVPAPSTPRLAAVQAQIALANDDLATALYWADQFDQDWGSHAFYRFFNLAKARLLIVQNEQDAARAYLARCYERASQAGWQYGQIAVRVLQSLVSPQPQALGFLAEALQLAQPERFTRTFVDTGEVLAPLLQRTINSNILPAYVNELLRAIDQEPKKTTVGQSILVEPLSERELEVLRLMAQGFTNREIAERLVISPGTVKTHVHNVCGKLGGRNRTEAVVRAKELGLA